MGGILGGGGGGGSGGDEANTTEKALPSPAQIAATREAFNTASGAAGVAKNLPYYAQIASSPGYRQALQNTANTWGDWMGQAPMDLSQGSAPITHGQFGDVIDAGAAMNQQIAGMDPAIQKILAQWTGPGAIKQGDAYSPAIYDPYVQQKPLLHQGSAAAGGVGTIGAGGIPTTALPGGGTPPSTTGGTGGTGGTGTPPPTQVGGNPIGGSGGGFTGAGGQTIRLGNRVYKKQANGKYVLVKGTGMGQGGMGTREPTGQGSGGFGGFASGGQLGGYGARGPTRIN